MLTWISDPAQYSSNGVREQTAELASLALSLDGYSRSLPPDRNHFPPGLDIFRSEGQSENAVLSEDDAGSSLAPESLEAGDSGPAAVSATGSSALTQMIRSPVAGSVEDRVSGDDGGGGGQEENEGGDNVRERTSTVINEPESSQTERTALLSKSYQGYGIAEDVENQGAMKKQRPRNAFYEGVSKVTNFSRIISNPKSWDGRAVWHSGIVRPASLLPSVFLGLLLNILDALSYGMILFPLGEPIFAELGSDGISMFYVSTIIAQVVFSSGGSIFAGGIGSEMIEVVPFFHQMAFTILQRVGEDNPKSVLATIVLAFSVSSVLTGLVFFLMGTCRLGSLIGFFPRHILIGCIGGVGFFLLQTGIEVSARLSGTLEYNLPTLEKLFHLDTLFLWMIPLLLAIGLLLLQRFVRSNFLVGGYFISVAVVFYIVKFSSQVSMDILRNQGWVFDAPSSSNPWYHFYTLYGKWLIKIHLSKPEG